MENTVLSRILKEAEDKGLHILYAQLRQGGEIKDEFKRAVNKTRLNAFSVSKSFVSAGAGIALEEGLISKDEKICDAFSEYVQKIDLKDIKRLNEFENSDNSEDVENLTKIMSDNGKNERVKFDDQVLNKAISERIKLAREEAKCYILIYDRTRKLLKELDNDSFKFSKYQKILRDVNAKLSFINAEKDYLVRFLDNERMTTMNGPKVHKDMMEEACKNFDLDVIQIQNLYEILLKEITNKATKKIYKELYNNGYLKEIEAAEKSFEKG